MTSMYNLSVWKNGLDEVPAGGKGSDNFVERL